MGAVKSCCKRRVDDKLMVTKMDLSHCGCLEVPPIVFNAERCIETLILASNQITSLPPQLFHCQEMKHLNLNDNCLTSIPPAIGSFQHLVSLKLDKNNLQELPDNLKMCKKLKRLSLNSNPWKQMPNIVTQLISLEELYMNDCELNYLPASVGRLAKLKIIELRNNNLCNLPLSMTRLEMLTRLDISDNEFNEFPTCISKLKALTELLLDNNDLEEIIDIKNLVHLEHLDASYNHITNVSETIGCCTHLNMLNFSFNYIEQLPNSIGNITHLQTLHLEMNELTEIPKSIGKLLHLEELNLCNNKLYGLPNTIGLLRNLRNLNVSRNSIEEFPPEIGSCTKLAIINAAYNRLRVLPPEIGYLNDIKVLDLVGNFLDHLPITVINLRGIRAIWLSANQNVPLIPFTEDLNLASGERFLTNIALPQSGEIPLSRSKSSGGEAENESCERTSSWNKKIRFAEDENGVLPGKLHRTPTPFPKELRAPSRKIRFDPDPKSIENYANLTGGKSSLEQEVSPRLLMVAESDSRIAHSEGETQGIHRTTCREESNVKNHVGSVIPSGSATRIKEANIRRNNKDPGFDGSSPEGNGLPGHLSACGWSSERRESEQLAPGEISPEDESEGRKSSAQDLEGPTVSPSPSRRETKSDSIRCESGEIHPAKSQSPPVIYSNLSEGCRPYGEEGKSEGENIRMDPQRIREMYQNDVIYGRGRNYKNGQHSTPAIAEIQPAKYQCSNGSAYRENFTRAPSISSNHGEGRRIYSTPPPPISANGGSFDRLGFRSAPPPPAPLPPLPPPAPPDDSSKPDGRPSKQDLMNSLAEQMKNRNISPPCYEIAKMYSTKAALFENNRLDRQLKSN